MPPSEPSISYREFPERRVRLRVSRALSLDKLIMIAAREFDEPRERVAAMTIESREAIPDLDGDELTIRFPAMRVPLPRDDIRRDLLAAGEDEIAQMIREEGDPENAPARSSCKLSKFCGECGLCQLCGKHQVVHVDGQGRCPDCSPALAELTAERDAYRDTVDASVGQMNATIRERDDARADVSRLSGRVEVLERAVSAFVAYEDERIGVTGQELCDIGDEQAATAGAVMTLPLYREAVRLARAALSGVPCVDRLGPIERKILDVLRDVEPCPSCEPFFDEALEMIDKLAPAPAGTSRTTGEEIPS